MDQLKPPLNLFQHKQWQQCYLHFRQALYTGNSGSVTTIERYDNILKRFFLDKARRPDEYTQQDVESFVNALTNGRRASGTPPMPRTRNSRLAVLQSFYTYATGYTVTFRKRPTPLFRAPNPTTSIQFGKTTDYYRAFEPDEIPRFFAQIPRDSIIGLRDRAMFIFYLTTARRRAEALSLTWGDLQQVIFDDKGREYQGWMYRWRGKGHAGVDDSAELPTSSIAALKEYLEADDRWNKMAADDWLFLSEKHNVRNRRQLAKNAANLRFCRYRDAAGLTPDLTIHSFRYTHACDLYENNGHNLMEVRERLRHEKMDTTVGYLKRRRRPKSDRLPDKMAQQYAAL